MNVNDTYIELIFHDSFFKDELEGVLSQFEPLGFLEEEDFWSCSFSRNQWDQIENECQDILTNQFPNISFEIREVESQNWNQNWESSITPQLITDRIVITPSWHPIEDESKIVIIIDPKMSFGTGYHPTTRLVIKLLEKYIRGDEYVLDLGTGTGVLAIASIKLGAQNAVGIDNDEWCYINAIENLELNHLQDKIKIVLGSIDSAESTFDLIVANITKNDIIDLLPQIITHTNEKTILLFSGILTIDSEEMLNEFEHYQLSLLESVTEEEWIAFAVTNAS